MKDTCPHCGESLEELFKAWLSKRNAKAGAKGGRTRTPARLANIRRAQKMRWDNHWARKRLAEEVQREANGLPKLKPKKKGSKHHEPNTRTNAGD